MFFCAISKLGVAKKLSKKWKINGFLLKKNDPKKSLIQWTENSIICFVKHPNITLGFILPRGPYPGKELLSVKIELSDENCGGDEGEMKGPEENEDEEREEEKEAVVSPHETLDMSSWSPSI